MPFNCGTGLAIASDAVNARFLIEDSLLQDGVTQYYFNQFENALKSLTILTELDPDNFEGLFTLALTLKSLGREAESNAILWRITNLHPQDEVDRNFREMSFKELQTSLENEDFESTAANANPLALFLTDCWQRIKRLIEQLTKSWVEKPIV
jgi:tetratricopeptide (TPR) repeat protein